MSPRCAWPTCLLFVLGGAAAEAQTDPARYFNAEDFSSEALYATGEIGAGARPAALAGAYAAIADDAFALVYNPAGLAQVRRIEVGIGLRHQRARSTHSMFGVRAAALATQSVLDHLTLSYPMPTYRGSLVFGLGLFHATSNELASSRLDIRRGADFEFRDRFQRSQEGGLWRFTAGLGVDLLRDLSFGGSLTYWRGHLDDDQYRDIDEAFASGAPLRFTDRLITEADAEGFSFDVGLLGYVGRDTRLALCVRSPVWMRIDGDGTLDHDDRLDDSGDTFDLLFIEDRPRLPWTLVAGASTALRNVLVTTELRYTAFDEIDLDAPRTGPGSVLPGQDGDYSAHLGFRAGAEFLVPRLPVRLRGGYAYDPVAYDLLLGNRSEVAQQRQSLTAGAGILVADTVTLDLAAAFARFETADAVFPQVFEKRSTRRIYFSGTYRY